MFSLNFYGIIYEEKTNNRKPKKQAEEHSQCFEAQGLLACRLVARQRIQPNFCLARAGWQNERQTWPRNKKQSRSYQRLIFL